MVIVIVITMDIGDIGGIKVRIYEEDNEIIPIYKEDGEVFIIYE